MSMACSLISAPQLDAIMDINANTVAAGLGYCDLIDTTVPPNTSVDELVHAREQHSILALAPHGSPQRLEIAKASSSKMLIMSKAPIKLMESPLTKRRQGDGQGVHRRFGIELFNLQ